MQSIMKPLVEMIRFALQNKTVTVKQLATEVGCSRQHIYQILNGENVPSMLMAEKLADAIGCEISLHVSTKSKKVSA